MTLLRSSGGTLFPFATCVHTAKKVDSLESWRERELGEINEDWLSNLRERGETLTSVCMVESEILQNGIGDKNFVQIKMYYVTSRRGGRCVLPRIAVIAN